MQIPSTLSIWLAEQAMPLIIIGVILIFVLGTLYISARSRRQRLTSERSGVNEDTFVESLELDGFDRNIARTTYRYLQERQNVHFPIHSTDDLDLDLGLDGEDVDQSVRELLDETDRLYQPGLKHMPLVTVEDLIRFLQASPRRSELAA